MGEKERDKAREEIRRLIELDKFAQRLENGGSVSFLELWPNMTPQEVIQKLRKSGMIK